LEILLLKLPKSFRVGERRSWDRPSEQIRVTELANLLKQFPRLKLFEIDSRLLVDENMSTDFDKILEQVREIRKAFPKVDLQIL
jgi:transaldolase